MPTLAVGMGNRASTHAHGKRGHGTPISRFLQFGRSTLGQGLLGAALLWAAFPPLDLWLLAWVAPIPVDFADSPPATRRPPAVHDARLGRFLVLDGRPALPAATPLGHQFRLGRPILLLCVLSAAVRGPVAGGCPSAPRASHSRRAGRLDRPGIGPRPPVDRYVDGQPRPYPVSLDRSDPIERPGRGLRRELCGHVRGGRVGQNASRRKGGQAFLPVGGG